MRQREQAEARARRAQPARDRFFLRLRVDGPHQRVKRQVKKQQEQHLRQPGERVLPKDVAEQDHGAAEEGDPLVEEPAREEKQWRERCQEQDHRHDHDHPVADVNRVALHRQVRAHREKSDRVDQRRQRRVKGVRPDFCGDVFAVALQLPGGERTRQFCFPKMPVQHLAADLRLVHRLRSGQPAKFVQQKKDRQANHERERERTPHPDDGPARFQCVNETLNRVGATRHLGKNPNVDPPQADRNPKETRISKYQKRPRQPLVSNF